MEQNCDLHQAPLSAVADEAVPQNRSTQKSMLQIFGRQKKIYKPISFIALLCLLWAFFRSWAAANRVGCMPSKVSRHVKMSVSVTQAASQAYR